MVFSSFWPFLIFLLLELCITFLSQQSHQTRRRWWQGQSPRFAGALCWRGHLLKPAVAVAYERCRAGLGLRFSSLKAPRGPLWLFAPCSAGIFKARSELIAPGSALRALSIAFVKGHVFSLSFIFIHHVEGRDLCLSRLPSLRFSPLNKCGQRETKPKAAARSPASRRKVSKAQRVFRHRLQSQ